MSRPGAAADLEARARKHFDRAVELSAATGGPFVSLAESISVQKQDAANSKPARAGLAINPDGGPNGGSLISSCNGGRDGCSAHR